MGAVEIVKDVYMVGGPDLTDPKDAAVYLINVGELLLIDSGAGNSVDAIAISIDELGFNSRDLAAVILTHCHIDHIGGAPRFREAFGAKIIMHERDAGPVERGDPRMTAASWYTIRFPPTRVDVALTAAEERLRFGSGEVVCLHTPGHTPGSLSVYLDHDGKRILFGQDIHGPFYESLGSNLGLWRTSMQTLLALDADILCEGHFGIYQPKEKVRAYIEHYLEVYEDEDIWS